MCLFLTAGFAPPSNQTLEQLAVGRPPLGFSVIHNASVLSCDEQALRLRAKAGLDEPIEYQRATVALEEISDDWLFSMREDFVYRVIRRE